MECYVKNAMEFFPHNVKKLHEIVENAKIFDEAMTTYMELYKTILPECYGIPLKSMAKIQFSSMESKTKKDM